MTAEARTPYPVVSAADPAPVVLSPVVPSGPAHAIPTRVARQGRARALRPVGAAAALLLLAGTAAYAVPRFAPRAEPAAVTAHDVATARPTTHGVLTGGDAARQRRWSTTAEDLLDATGVTAQRIAVIEPSGAGAGPGPVPAGSETPPDPVVALGTGVVGADAGVSAMARARVVGIDPTSGSIRWRGPILGDVPDCARTESLLACAERTADAGRVVLLDPHDGREIARTAVPGRVLRVSVTGEAAYVVAATPVPAATRLDLTQVDASGTVGWTRSDLAPPGALPEAVTSIGDGILVTGVAVQGRELLVSARDGALVADRRAGAALTASDGTHPVAADEGEWLATPDGARLTGVPVRPLAHDAATSLPLLARRYGAGRTGDLVAYADPRRAEPAWTLPGATPLAACGSRLIVARPGGAAPSAAAETGAATGPEVAAIVPATGAVTWRIAFDGQLPTSAVCTPGTVVLSGRGGSGSVAALRLDTGAEAWTTAPGAPTVPTAPTAPTVPTAPTGLAPADAEPARLTARGPDLLVASRLSSSARLDYLG